MKETHDAILENVYAVAEEVCSIGENAPSFSVPETQARLNTIVERAEANRGILAVLTTLVVHKIYDPTQDIRYHQAQLPGGFAGRGIDSAYITPFLKRKNFPAMADTGWLTRSLEQPHAYTLDYPGKIRPESTKSAFLQLVDSLQNGLEKPRDLLLGLFVALIRRRDSETVELAKPHKLPISAIIHLLEKHFTHRYPCSGAARLPVLAMYAIYQCIITGERFKGKVLCELESHTSADRRSGRIGDIDVNFKDGTPFEGVEVKHGIQITRQLVADAYEKFKQFKTERYYLLTTANMDSADWSSIEAEIQKVGQIHGCQVIVNGVYSTLRYYLRLLPDPADFIDKYVELVKNDSAIKYQHKIAWNECVVD